MAAETKDYPLILLAGGKSERMGTPKGLLAFGDHLWIDEQMDRFARASGLGGVTVLGYRSELYHDRVAARAGWQIVVNPQPEFGPFSSIQAGARHVLSNRSAIGAFVLPVDVPAAPPEVFQLLANALTDGVRAATPQLQGQGGHPVLLSAAFLDHLVSLDPSLPDSRLDRQLHLLGSNQIRRVPVSAPEITMNFNTPEDWKKLRL